MPAAASKASLNLHMSGEAESPVRERELEDVRVGASLFQMRSHVQERECAGVE